MSSKLLPIDGDHQSQPSPWIPVQPNVPKAAEPEVDRQAIFEAKLQEAQRACEQRVKEARTAGLREGEEKANEKAAQEVRSMIERAARSVEEIAALRPRLRREAEADLVKLALTIARRVVYRELAIDADAMRGVVLAALEKLQGQEVSRVRVHPDLAKMLSEELRRVGGARAVEVIPDPSSERGALIFETSRGNLDGSVETQLQEIERGLTDRLRRLG
jgi:flagellar assembly protein FliH